MNTIEGTISFRHYTFFSFRLSFRWSTVYIDVVVAVVSGNK